MGLDSREDLKACAEEHERAQELRDLLARMTRDHQGKRIGERYVLGACIGAGGMGLVFLGEQPELGRPVVLKLLREGVVSDERNRQRFEREAVSLARLHHPNIVRLYDFGHHRQRAYIVMEYVDGETLSACMKRRGRLDYDFVVHVAVQLLGALAHAHDQNIAHRDIKPSNVMLCTGPDGGDVVKVLDFGLAKLMDDEEELAQDELIGSTRYLAPERITGGCGDERSDVYALGVMLYEMISGQLPFGADSDLELLAKHVHEEPRPLSLRLPLGHEYPDEVLKLVHSFLAKDPAARPDDAAQALERFIEHAINRKAPSSAPWHTTTRSTLRVREAVAQERGPMAPRMLDAPIAHGSHTDEYLALRPQTCPREHMSPGMMLSSRLMRPKLLGIALVAIALAALMWKV